LIFGMEWNGKLWHTLVDVWLRLGRSSEPRLFGLDKALPREPINHGVFFFPLPNHLTVSRVLPNIFNRYRICARELPSVPVEPRFQPNHEWSFVNRIEPFRRPIRVYCTGDGVACGTPNISSYYFSYPVNSGDAWRTKYIFPFFEIASITSREEGVLKLRLEVNQQFAVMSFVQTEMALI
ncbi:MAG: hypothetical protein ABI811_02270, partial [Acidobacteriota bacterium]